MQKFLIFFLFLNVVCCAEEMETKDVMSWLKSELSETLAKNKKTHVEGQVQIKKCTTGMSEPKDPNLLVFVSFSIPDETLLAIAEEVNQNDGVLVLRGMPENNFKILAKHLLTLKEKGLTASLQINPKLFQEYEISKVPTFVMRGKKGFDKVSGNISLEHAMGLFQSTNEEADG
jgi:type-F conjugative transfer system pilin assembly protein TrbC